VFPDVTAGGGGGLTGGEEGTEALNRLSVSSLPAKASRSAVLLFVYPRTVVESSLVIPDSSE